jgi:hypothetical protein
MTSTIAKLLPEINANQLKMLHKLLLDEVIGADNVWNDFSDPADAYVRNDLRVEQRTKLTALLGENEEL